MQLNTFSMVAYDPDEQSFGVAVASKFLAAAAVVSWAKAGVGAVATQSHAKISFGPDGLALMAQGKSAQETLDLLLANDPARERRQVGLVDARGGTAAYTGTQCSPFAGHRTGTNFAVQGNILAGAQVLDAMVEAYQGASGELADRLVAALQAAEAAGGDRRGKQSAGVLVVKPNGGYGGDNDRYLDLRVDDDSDPIAKLAELVKIHHLYFGTPHPEDQLPITEDLARELQTIMQRHGFYSGEINGKWDTPSIHAFWDLISNENLEERWQMDRQPDKLDRVALEYLRERLSRIET